MKCYNHSEAQNLINHLGNGDDAFFFIIDYEQEHCYVSLLKDIDSEDMMYAFPSASNFTETPSTLPEQLIWDIAPESAESYRKKFDIVQKNLFMGNSYLTNLTCRIPVMTNLSLKDIFAHSHAPYKVWLKNQLVCFSPETFIRIHGGTISSYPMKGTIDATLPQAAERLMNDRKEAAEHATIVDLIRNDLSMVAKDVHVPRYRYVEEVQTNKGPILETSSEISGTLAEDYRSHMGDILFSQLPAGSITGAPKVKTTQIIREAEDYDRGFYTGVMGICNQGEMESAVMIRFIEQSDGQFFFKAGGGITALSCCNDEYNEVIQKAYVPIY